MDDVYQFDALFRKKLLALCLQPSWFVQYGTQLILPEYFQSDRERQVAEAILEFYDRYRRVPSDYADILTLCQEDFQEVEFVKSLFKSYELSLVKDEAIAWAKEQAAKNAILDSLDDVKAGRLDYVVDRVKRAALVGEDLSATGLDLIGDVDDWLTEEAVFDKIRTGLIHMDRRLGGGVGIGELFVWMGPPNSGKSMALVESSYGMAGLGSEKNVAVFTLEMLPNKWAKRLAARMMFRFPDRGGVDEYREEFKHVAKLMMPGSIRIMGGGRMTTTQIEGHLERLTAEDWIPDAVVVDYGDLVIPPRHRNQRRFELTETFEWLRDLGMPGHITEKGFPVLTATQSGRASLNKEIITMKDVAEDIGKVNTADEVVAICQTMEEKIKGRCRLFGAKIRDEESGFMIDAKYDSKSQAIVTTGYSRRQVEEEEL